MNSVRRPGCCGCLSALVFLSAVRALDNGLARTPPMGWLSWQRFRCLADCRRDPEDCVSEQLLMSTADLMESEGYLEAGYDILSVDDCWMAQRRTKDGVLLADDQRFPSGMKALADYVHSNGLRFGIYQSYGSRTCQGYPGIVGHMDVDAATFAEWSVDYVKLDGCYVDPKTMDVGYRQFGDLLNATGRPVIYSCSWPVYQQFAGIKPNFTAVTSTCNLWRNYVDIQDSWSSVLSIIDYYGDNQDQLVPLAGPGHWNDPDMLIIGNFGPSYDQSKVQMAIWSILAAPLFMSVDLRTMKTEMKDILLNERVIAIDQDPLGVQGRRIRKRAGKEIWLKPVLPRVQDRLSAALAFFNRRTDGVPRSMSITLERVGLNAECGYRVVELFDGLDMGGRMANETLRVRVHPSGIVLVKLTVQSCIGNAGSG